MSRSGLDPCLVGRARLDGCGGIYVLSLDEVRPDDLDTRSGRKVLVKVGSSREHLYDRLQTYHTYTVSPSCFFFAVLLHARALL